MRRGRKVALAVALVLVVGAAGSAYAASRRPDQAATPRTVAAALGTMEQTVTSTGTIEPATEADLSFGSAGTVLTVPVTVGEHVRKGQILATMDASTLQSQVTLAEAQVTQADAQVTAATGGTSTQVASADAQLASAEAKLSSARAALAGATLTSPIDGVIATVALAPGEHVGAASGSGSSARSSGASGSGSAAGGTSGSSSAQVSVITTDSWVVDAQVTNSDLPRLKTGLQARILPTGSRQPIFGTVSAIGLVATSSASGVAEFPVTITVTGRQTGLYAGTTASVSIVVRQLQNVLTVPTAAISYQGGKPSVTVLSNGRQVQVPVTVGQMFGTETQVTAGLAEGAEVVIPTTTRTASTGTTGTGRVGGGFGFGGGAFRGGARANSGG